MFFLPEPAQRQPGAPPAPDVRPYRAVYPQLVAELRRARRYEHCFAVVVLSATAPAIGGGSSTPGSAALMPVGFTPTLYFLLGGVLRNTLRETDILTAAPESLAYALFLAETDRERAAQAVRRLRERFRECAGADLRTGCAEFPRDGLTIDDLVDGAWRAWQHASDHDAAPRVAPEASHG